MNRQLHSRPCTNGPAAVSLRLWILVAGSLPFAASGQPDPCALNFDGVNSPNSPGLLIGQASAYDSRRQVAVLFGGENPLTGVFSTSNTWEWTGDRKSTRLNSSHLGISYAVFCLKT